MIRLTIDEVVLVMGPSCVRYHAERLAALQTIWLVWAFSACSVSKARKGRRKGDSEWNSISSAVDFVTPSVFALALLGGFPGLPKALVFQQACDSYF